MPDNFGNYYINILILSMLAITCFCCCYYKYKSSNNPNKIIHLIPTVKGYIITDEFKKEISID